MLSYSLFFLFPLLNLISIDDTFSISSYNFTLHILLWSLKMNADWTIPRMIILLLLIILGYIWSCVKVNPIITHSLTGKSIAGLVLIASFLLSKLMWSIESYRGTDNNFTFHFMHSCRQPVHYLNHSFHWSNGGWINPNSIVAGISNELLLLMLKCIIFIILFVLMAFFLLYN